MDGWPLVPNHGGEKVHTILHCGGTLSSAHFATGVITRIPTTTAVITLLLDLDF